MTSENEFYSHENEIKKDLRDAIYKMQCASLELDELHAQRAAFAEDQWARSLPYAHISVAAITSHITHRIAAAESSYAQSVVVVYRQRVRLADCQSSMDRQ